MPCTDPPPFMARAECPGRRGRFTMLPTRRQRANSARTWSSPALRPAAMSSSASARASWVPRLRRPEQGLLDRLPLLGTDQHRDRRTVLGDHDLLMDDRSGVHQFAQLVADLGKRQRLHPSTVRRGPSGQHATAGLVMGTSLGARRRVLRSPLRPRLARAISPSVYPRVGGRPRPTLRRASPGGGRPSAG